MGDQGTASKPLRALPKPPQIHVAAITKHDIKISAWVVLASDVGWLADSK
jgi:hypothetical protein